MDTSRRDPVVPTPGPGSDLLAQLRNFGEFRILRLIGEGGMGFVYLCYHEGQDRQVAVKVLADQLSSSQAYIDRFYREAKSGALLNHPNIVRSLGAGQDKATGKHYLVMEYVDGVSVRVLIERYTRLSVGDGVHIALDIARALEHAHSRNIVHRDIKPDNILVTRSGVAKLADLGLSKRTDEASYLTAARQGFGTPHYMPYEQAMNAKHADGRSDIYALGATLYHLVTGEVPFAGENHIEVIDKKNRGELRSAQSLNPEVPPVLDQILRTMLARHPRDRYQTASELIVDLERSHLAVPVLSFVDPDLARQDPWVQTYLTTTAEPTRLDVGSPNAAEPTLAPGGSLWHLRYRGRDGNWHRVRATTEQLVQRLRENRMPPTIEASLLGKEEFRPLNTYPEFCRIKPTHKSAPAVPKTSPPPSTSEQAATLPVIELGFRRSWRLWLGGGAAVISLMLLGLLLYKFFLK